MQTEFRKILSLLIEFTVEHVIREIPVGIMSPHHGWGGGGHIVFSADPGGIGVASSPHSISLLKGHILAKLTQIYHWEGEKC